MYESILAIETSSEACSAALRVGTSEALREERLPRRHQERLPMMIRELLEQSGLRRRDLSAVAFGRGPGSFTGLRLAAATAQAWGMAGNLPVHGVSSLAAIALKAARKLDVRGHICALIKARAGEVYRGDFVWDGTSLEASAAERRVSAADFEFAASTELAAGDGCTEVDCAAVRCEPLLLPGAEAVLALAPATPACDAASALPVYLQSDSEWGRQA